MEESSPRPMCDLSDGIIGNEKDLPGKIHGRSCPPHTKLGVQPVHGRFLEGVAFKNSALHSEASYRGPQVRYFSGTSTKITFLGASAEILFSTWAQNFPFLALPHLPLFWLWVHKWSFVAGSSADSPLCLCCIHLTLAWYCSVGTNGTLGSQSLILPLACTVTVSE